MPLIIVAMAIIGITGSIASGKSTFRNILAPLISAQVLDADLIARGLLENNPAVREEVASAISPLAYKADGSADRAEIRRIIYNDPDAKARLEAILHPRVRTTWVGAVEQARKEGRNAIVDIPLLFETAAEGAFDFVVTVACSPDVQSTRLVARGLDPVLAQKIIGTQMPVAEKIAKSSQVVWNDGDLDALTQQAEIFAGLLDDSA